jgi:3-methyladenine DNA glycosylase AlkD
MPTVESVVANLRSKASEKTRAILIRHGSDADRTLGVSVADMKAIAKGLKGQQELALKIYATGFLEAMYLAGMVANGAKMSKKELEGWAKGAHGMQMIAEYTVPWVAVESAHGRELAIEWIGSKTEHIATSGWCTYSGLVATNADDALDLAEIEGLLKKISTDIHKAPNRARHTMNNFVICVGSYVKPLNAQAKAAAKKYGAVEVDMGETACKVPDATAYIAKVEGMSRQGVKKKTIRC